MFDRLIHKWLKVPYTLHTEIRKPKGRARATLVFMHGIGNSSRTWDAVIEKLPDDIRIVSIDLLGFGQSPRPSWAKYNAHTQARSVIASLVKVPISGQVILIGHSLGALVAVEIAKRYPIIVKSLILCSPPFYLADTAKPALLPRSDKMLRRIYSAAQKRPEQFVRMASFAIKYGLANKGFNITSDTVDTYMATLESAIINQTAFEDAKHLDKPIHIIRGTLDPVVIARNIKDLSKLNPNITVSTVAASHDIRGLFVPAVVKAITKVLPPTKKTKRASKV